MTKISRLYPFFLLFGFVLFAQGCNDDDDPVVENEEEVITRVTYTLTPDDANNETVIFSFVDVDGEGGNNPVITTIGTLAADSKYSGAITFANENEPITPEIREEDKEHQVFYITGGGLNLTPSYGDSDGDGNPLGLVTEVSTGNASTGTLQVVLRHEPTKGSGTTIANLAAAGGETDIEVTFNATIQ